MVFALLAAAEVAASATGSSRGERRAELTAKFDDVLLGVAETDGPSAARREELIATAQDGILKGEFRLVPGSAGMFRAAAEAGVHFESLGLVLGARTVSLGRMQLRAAAARLELEGDLLEDLRAGLSASIWALDLAAPRSRDPWNAFGRATLDWPQRWELGWWASRGIGPVSLTPSGSLSQAPTSMEARGALGIEVQIGPAKLRAEAGAARLFDARMWLFDLTGAIALALQ